MSYNAVSIGSSLQVWTRAQGDGVTKKLIEVKASPPSGSMQAGSLSAPLLTYLPQHSDTLLNKEQPISAMDLKCQSRGGSGSWKQVNVCNERG